MTEHMVTISLFKWSLAAFKAARYEYDLAVYSCSYSVPFGVSSEVSTSEGLCSCLPKK